MTPLKQLLIIEAERVASECFSSKMITTGTWESKPYKLQSHHLAV
jgi:hypothetical protein